MSRLVPIWSKLLTEGMTDRSDNPPIAFLHALANIFLPKLLIWLVERGLVEGNPTARQGTQPEIYGLRFGSGP